MRALGAALLMLSLAAPGYAAPAGSCPELSGATLRWIVTSAAGGGYDTYSRLLEPHLERELGARILIENRPGAGGIVGAMAIRDAPADGRTLGIVNASGLLAAHAVDGANVPDPANDFTILASIVSNHLTMFTGRDSGIADIDGLLQIARSRPIVAGVNSAGSASFHALPVTASLLGFDYELVTGYEGGSARTLAAMRGEVDIVMGNFDSLQAQVRAGELVPIVQLDSAGGAGPSVPSIAGPQGLARSRAPFTGRTPDEAEREAADLAAFVGAGRIVVAPAGLSPALLACLDSTLASVLGSDAFRAAAQRAELGIDPVGAATARSEVLAGAAALQRFGPLITAALEQARQ